MVARRDLSDWSHVNGMLAQGLRKVENDVYRP
jgi:hypothetical protein